MSNPATGEAALYAERRYFGKYRGSVTDVQDPHRLGRVKCRVNEILGNIETDWATLAASLYGGSSDYGSFQVPEVGSTIFVEFESGDVNRPVVTGIWWGHPKGKPPETPALARSDGDKCWKTDDSTKSPKGDDKFKSADCVDQCQPGSPLRVKGPPEYPFNQVLKTKNNGIIIEIDDTPGQGRVHLWHGPSKSWFELDVDGELSIRVADKSYVEIDKDARLHVKESKHSYIEKSMTHLVDEERWLTIGKDEKRQTKGKRDTFVTKEENRVNSDKLSSFVDGDEVRVRKAKLDRFVTGEEVRSNQGKVSQFITGEELRQNLNKVTRIVAGAEAKLNANGETKYTLGEEKKVNVGNFTNWTIGQRVEVVVGSFQQIVLGDWQASVFGNYTRTALGVIMDMASAIVHTSGSPSASIPFPPMPPIPTVPPIAPIAPLAPICPTPATCPPIPMDEDCPPLPTT